MQADSSGDPCPDLNYPRQTPDGCQASNLPDIPQDNGIVRPPERILTVAPKVSAPALQFQYSTPSASPSAPALPNTGGSSLLALGAGVLLVRWGASSPQDLSPRDSVGIPGYEDTEDVERGENSV